MSKIWLTYLSFTIELYTKTIQSVHISIIFLILILFILFTRCLDQNGWDYAKAAKVFTNLNVRAL